MITLATVFLLFLLWELIRRFSAPLPSPRFNLERRRLAAAVATLCVALIVLFWQEARLLTQMVALQKNAPNWLTLAPAGWLVHEGVTTNATAVFLVTLFESGLLAALYFILKDAQSRAASAIVIAGAIVMVSIAAVTPITNPDVYAYIGYGKLGLAGSYSPPHVAFTGAFSVINDRWGTPLLVSDYGPLFIALQSLLVASAHSLSLAFAIERGFDIIVFACVLFSLRKLGADLATLAVMALNPAILYLYIITAHNDLLSVLFLLIAFALVRRYPWLAAAAVVASGLIKIVFCIAGLIVFADLRRTTPVRLAYAAACVLGCALILWLVGGHAYIASLLFVSKVQLAHIPMRFIVLQRIFALIALGAIAVALIAKRFMAAAMWSMPALGARIYPWYVVWSLPYALRANALPAFLIPLPAIAYSTDPLFAVGGHAFALVVAAVITAMIAIALLQQRYRASAHRTAA